MLARLGAERAPDPTPPADPVREELRALAQRRDQLKRMETQEKNRLSVTTHPRVAKDIREELANLARRLARIDKAIADHLDRHQPLAEDAACCARSRASAPSPPPSSSRISAELGQVDGRAIASLGGVAPRAHESGRRRGKRFLGEGRRHVRRALYMAALSALRHPGFLADLVARLRAKHKPGKVILMAVARHLLVIANAILRSRIPFQPKRQAAA